MIFLKIGTVNVSVPYLSKDLSQRVMEHAHKASARKKKGANGTDPRVIAFGS